MLSDLAHGELTEMFRFPLIAYVPRLWRLIHCPSVPFMFKQGLYDRPAYSIFSYGTTVGCIY